MAEDSGSTLDEGIVIEDKNTNQFVWVPVSKANFDTQFKRRDGYYNNNPQTLTADYGEADGNSETGANTNTGVTESETTKSEVKLMYESVYNNEGFYIGRYEAGRDSTDSNKVVIQKGANVYNNIKWGNSMTDDTGGAVQLARGFAGEKGYKTVTSTLCYGVQWDATLTWIDPDYTGFAKDSTGKGYYNASHPTTTGSSSDYEVKKIYDLAGNVWEWTMESFLTSRRVVRGGGYNFSGSGSPASGRYYAFPSDIGPGVGFRVTLYL